ncbi:MAG: LysR family transcriptional regulator [Polyangiaceae bacterium]
MSSDLHALQVFTKVVQSGSFTSAAQALKMPKSTVSQRVSELEERLGVRLLNARHESSASRTQVASTTSTAFASWPR